LIIIHPWSLMNETMASDQKFNELLSTIGARVRALRQEAHLTVKELAERASLSHRFLIKLEAGTSNISIRSLAQVAAVLGRPLPHLIPPSSDDHSWRAQTWRLLNECDDDDGSALQKWLEERSGASPFPRFIALIGLRGVGKSTIGQLLAKRLKTQFIEIDRWVEEAAGAKVGDIFTNYGDGYYHRLEREALGKLFADANTSRGCVFAPGGSVVTVTESWELIKRRCFTIWLHATPETLLRRIGNKCPTKQREGCSIALAELKTLLERREPFYAESNLTIKTTSKSPNAIVSEIIKAMPGSETISRSGERRVASTR
jgi:XRE family transcriptional regulator, aerobic/anaerobic benzoate catabolism transcriptional regulator